MKVVRLSAFVLFALFGWFAFAQDTKGGGQDPKKDQETAEEKMRRAIQEEWQRRVAREEKVITIDRKNAKISEVLDDFRAQAAVNFVVDYRNIPEDYRIDEFKLVKEPFRTALEAFLAKAELTVVEETATLVKLARPARVSFNFKDTDVRTVIDMIARISGANIVVAPEVKGPISVSVNNVPWIEVLNAIAKTLNFTTVREKYDLIRVIDPKELQRQMEVRVYRLKYIQPPGTYKPKVKESELISGKPLQPQQQLEQRLKEFVLVEVLKSALSHDATGKQQLGSLSFDTITNAFVVRDTKPVLDRIEEILKMIDIEPEQVLIDVKFVSTSNQDLLSFGMNYTFGAGAEDDITGITVRTRPLFPTNQGTAPTGLTQSPFTETWAGKSTRLPFGFGHEAIISDQFFLTEYQMTATLRAYKRDRFSKIIQEPTLAVVDNTEATIFVGEEIRYAEVSTEFLGTSGTPSTSIKEAARSPVKVGFQLYIMPKIVSDQNKVILTIIPENTVLSGTGSPITGFDRFTITQNGLTNAIDLPHVSTTTIVTKIILESGRTAVLGGLVQETSSYQDKGIPLLKDIPIISYLFKQRDDNVIKRHLLIFITPRIVRSGRGGAELLDQATKQRDEAMRLEMEQLKMKTGREELLKQEEERRKRELEDLEKIRRGEK